AAIKWTCFCGLYKLRLRGLEIEHCADGGCYGVRCKCVGRWRLGFRLLDHWSALDCLDWGSAAVLRASGEVSRASESADSVRPDRHRHRHLVMVGEPRSQALQALRADDRAPGGSTRQGARRSS